MFVLCTHPSYVENFSFAAMGIGARDRSMLRGSAQPFTDYLSRLCCRFFICYRDYLSPRRQTEDLQHKPEKVIVMIILTVSIDCVHANLETCCLWQAYVTILTLLLVPYYANHELDQLLSQCRIAGLKDPANICCCLGSRYSLTSWVCNNLWATWSPVWLLMCKSTFYLVRAMF